MWSSRRRSTGPWRAAWMRRRTLVRCMTWVKSQELGTSPFFLWVNQRTQWPFFNSSERIKMGISTIIGGSPKSGWMIYKGTSHLEMDDDLAVPLWLRKPRCECCWYTKIHCLMAIWAHIAWWKLLNKMPESQAALGNMLHGIQRNW